MGLYNAEGQLYLSHYPDFSNLQGMTKLINLRNPPRVRELIQKNKSKGSDAAGLRNGGFEKSPEFDGSDTVVSETLP